jgi:hypothetical protein
VLLSKCTPAIGESQRVLLQSTLTWENTNSLNATLQFTDTLRSHITNIILQISITRTVSRTDYYHASNYYHASLGYDLSLEFSVQETVFRIDIFPYTQLQ